MNEEELLDWALGLNDSEREYLLAVAASENETTIQLTSSQDSKIIAVFGWSVLGVGTLAVADVVSLSWSLQGVTSLLAIAMGVVVLGSGTFALWPRPLSLGVKSGWFPQWKDPTTTNLQAYALAALLKSNELNDHLLNRRSLAQKVMGSALAAQVALIIAALITKAASG